jgi:hypothetical protein
MRFVLLQKERSPCFKKLYELKMNSTEYLFDVTNFEAWCPGTEICRIRSQTIWGTTTGVATDFPYWFDIRRSRSGSICAILMPKEFPIPYIDIPGACNFQIPTADVNGNPLSIQKVYFYDQGTLNYSKFNCGNKKYFDIYCLCSTYKAMCDLKGTFNLTFRNGLGEIITLSDGKFQHINTLQ